MERFETSAHEMKQTPKFSNERTCFYLGKVSFPPREGEHLDLQSVAFLKEDKFDREGCITSRGLVKCKDSSNFTWQYARNKYVHRLGEYQDAPRCTNCIKYKEEIDNKTTIIALGTERKNILISRYCFC